MASNNKPYKTYLVGGAIRDRLLDLPVLDRDWVVVGANPEVMINEGYEPVGKDFPVFINKESGEEYALARTERKTAKGYQGFQFNASPEITLEQDLERRDLTINAMAEDADGNIIDYHNGQADLEAGIIRHVLMLMKEMVNNGEVDALVPERVWAEMRKALDTDAPQIFFQVLRDCGALKKILPEIDNLFGVPQTAKYHPEIDTGVHTLMVIEQAARLTNDTMVRFAALTHDLGKALTPADILPSHRGHEKSGLPLIKGLCERLRVPKKFQSLALAVGEYHLHMHKMYELKAKTILNVLEKTRTLMDDERAKQFALCCLADARGRTTFEDRTYSQAGLFIRFQQAAKSVNGGEIAKGMSDGEAIQNAIRQARIEKLNELERGVPLD